MDMSGKEGAPRVNAGAGTGYKAPRSRLVPHGPPRGALPRGIGRGWTTFISLRPPAGGAPCGGAGGVAK
jgi:hypothetical protein